MSSLMNASEAHGAENNLLSSFLSQFVVPRRDEEEDDDWLKANFSDPDDVNNENNTDNDNVPELDEQDEEDEGVLEATRLHQVGFYDKDGTPYGRVYTRESLETAEVIAGESCFNSDDEDADDEGDFFNNNATFSAMEAYHAFAMRKRVEEANERWRTSHTKAPNCHHRESKVQFAQLIQMFAVEQPTDDEGNKSDRPCKPVVTFKPLPQDPISYDEEMGDEQGPYTQKFEPLTQQAAPLTLPADPLRNSAIGIFENPAKEIDLIDFHASAPEETSDFVQTTVQLLKDGPLEPSKDHLEPFKVSMGPSESTPESEKPLKTDLIPPKIVRKPMKQPENSENPSKIQLKLQKIEPEKFEKQPKSSKKSVQGTGLPAPKSERKPRSTPKPKSDSNIPQNDPPKVIRRSTKTTVSSFSIFPPAQSHAESSGMNPILQSILDPKTLSALTRSWSNNPVNVHMLRELKSQILRHNIPRTALQPFVNRRMMSIIFDLPAEKVLSDFMRETVSSRGRNQNLRGASPSPARISLSAEGNHIKSLARMRSGGQSSSSAVAMKSAAVMKTATILKSESVSKWASKPANLKGSSSSGKFKKSAVGGRYMGGAKLVPVCKISTTTHVGGIQIGAPKGAQPTNGTKRAERVKETKAGNLKPVRAYSSLENKAEKVRKSQKHEPETKSCCSFSGSSSADKISRRAGSLKGKSRKKKQIAQISKSKLENGFLALSLSKKILDITTMSSTTSSRALFSAHNLTQSSPLTHTRTSSSTTARSPGAGLEKPLLPSSVLKRKQVKGRVLEMIK